MILKSRRVQLMRRTGAEIDHGNAPAARLTHEHHADPADPAHPGLGHAGGKSRCDGRIDGIATPTQDLDPGLRRDTVMGRNHTARTTYHGLADGGGTRKVFRQCVTA